MDNYSEEILKLDLSQTLEEIEKVKTKLESLEAQLREVDPSAPMFEALNDQLVEMFGKLSELGNHFIDLSETEEKLKDALGEIGEKMTETSQRLDESLDKLNAATEGTQEYTEALIESQQANVDNNAAMVEYVETLNELGKTNGLASITEENINGLHEQRDAIVEVTEELQTMDNTTEEYAARAQEATDMQANFNKEIVDSIADLQDVQYSLIEVDQKAQETVGSFKTMKDLNGYIKDLKDALVGLERGTDEYNQKLSELNAAMEKKKQIQDDVRNGVVAEAGSYNELSQTLYRLTKEYHACTTEAERMAKAKEINKVKDELKRMDAQVGTFSRNVGNYTNSIREAFGNLGKFMPTQFDGVFSKLTNVFEMITSKAPEVSKALEGAIGQGAKAMEAGGAEMAATAEGTVGAIGGSFEALVPLMTNPVTIAVAAIVALVAGAVEVFKNAIDSSWEKMQEFENSFGATSEAMGIVWDNMCTDFMEKNKGAFDSIGNIWDNFCNEVINIVQYIVDAYNNSMLKKIIDATLWAVDKITSAIRVVRELFLNFLAEALDAFREFIKPISSFLNTISFGMLDINAQIEEAANNLRKYANSFREAQKEAKDLMDKRHDLQQKELDAQNKLAENEAKINELRAIATDRENVSAQDRKKALQEINKLEKENVQTNLDIANAKYEIIKQENARGESTYENQMKEQKALAETTKLRGEMAAKDAEYNRSVRRINNEIAAQQKAEAQAAKAKSEAQKKEIKAKLDALKQYNKELDKIGDNGVKQTKKVDDAVKKLYGEVNKDIIDQDQDIKNLEAESTKNLMNDIMSFAASTEESLDNIANLSKEKIGETKEAMQRLQEQLANADSVDEWKKILGEWFKVTSAFSEDTQEMLSEAISSGMEIDPSKFDDEGLKQWINTYNQKLKERKSMIDPVKEKRAMDRFLENTKKSLETFDNMWSNVVENRDKNSRRINEIMSYLTINKPILDKNKQGQEAFVKSWDAFTLKTMNTCVKWSDEMQAIFESMYDPANVNIDNLTIMADRMIEESVKSLGFTVKDLVDENGKIIEERFAIVWKNIHDLFTFEGSGVFSELFDALLRDRAWQAYSADIAKARADTLNMASATDKLKIHIGQLQTDVDVKAKYIKKSITALTQDIEKEIQRAPTIWSAIFSPDEKGVDLQAQRDDIINDYKSTMGTLNAEMEGYNAELAANDLLLSSLQEGTEAYEQAMLDRNAILNKMSANTASANNKIIESNNKLGDNTDALKKKLKLTYATMKSSIENLVDNVSTAWHDYLQAQVDAGDMSEDEAERQFEIMKDMQIAVAVVNVIGGMIGAYMNDIKSGVYQPPYSFIIGAADMASVAALGATQIMEIENTSFGSGSESVQSNGGGRASVAVSPLLDTNVDRMSMQTLSSSVDYDANDQNIRVWIAQSDLEDSHNQVRTRLEESSF